MWLLALKIRGILFALFFFSFLLALDFSNLIFFQILLKENSLQFFPLCFSFTLPSFPPFFPTFFMRFPILLLLSSSFFSHYSPTFFPRFPLFSPFISPFSAHFHPTCFTLFLLFFSSYNPSFLYFSPIFPLIPPYILPNFPLTNS